MISANQKERALNDYDDHRPLKGCPAASGVSPSAFTSASNNSLGQISRKKRPLDEDDERPQPFKKTRHISSGALQPSREMGLGKITSRSTCRNILIPHQELLSRMNQNGQTEAQERDCW
ncbi:hypothetical protein FALCPG4_017219 [Fusarium falciforme]